MKKLLVTAALASILAGCASTGTTEAAKADTSAAKAAETTTTSQTTTTAAPAPIAVASVNAAPAQVADVETAAPKMDSKAMKAAKAAKCDALYAEYEAGLKKFPEPKAKKKKSFFSSIAGSGIATLAAGMAGVNPGVLRAIDTADKTARIVKQTQAVKSQVNDFNNVKDRAELHAKSFEYAEQYGCDEKKLIKISKAN